MKLTDKEIIEALKAGKMIVSTRGFKYKLGTTGLLETSENRGDLCFNVGDLMADYEIVKPEIDWDKVIIDDYLCTFWNDLKEPTIFCHVAFLSKFSKVTQTFMDRQGSHWQHCRPLRADEVKLVTDEKELWK